MAIVTRCPACDTVFRVAPDQLQARNGMVRCGRCLTVFDGFRTLATAPDAPAAEPAAPPAAAAGHDLPPVPSPGPSGPAEGGAQSMASADAAAARPPDEPAFRLEPVSATELAAAATAAPAPTERSEAGDDSRDFGPAPEQLTLEDHLFLEQVRDARARHARLWAAGAAVMLVVLVLQAVYVFRGEIAAYFPAARPHLTRLCNELGCAVHLPQRPRQIAIEASDLQATDAARPGLIQLTTTVRNHAGHDVGYPALDLVLTNTRDHTLARRIFPPSDYLEPGRDARAGIAANAEVTINLELDTGDLNPAGFRLDLLPATGQ